MSGARERRSGARAREGVARAREKEWRARERSSGAREREGVARKKKERWGNGRKVREREGGREGERDHTHTPRTHASNPREKSHT